MTRVRAAAIHLGISAVIAVILFSLVFYFWYPEPYFEAAGAQFLWYLLVFVDIVLGPFLTLIVFKPGKPGLKFDLTFIAVAQLCAFLYGFSVIAEARPAFVVFVVDRFNVVPANWVSPEAMVRAREINPHQQYHELSWSGPVLAAARRPDDKGEREALFFSALSGYDIETFPEYFVPYAELASEAVAKAKPLTVLIERHPDQEAKIQGWIKAAGYSLDDVRFLPMTATRRDMALVLEATTGDIVTALPLSPWPENNE